MERDSKQDLILACFLALLLHAVLLSLRLPEPDRSPAPGRQRLAISVGLVARQPAAEVRSQKKGAREAETTAARKAPLSPPQRHKAIPKPEVRAIPEKPKPEPAAQPTPQPLAAKAEKAPEEIPKSADSPETVATSTSPSVGVSTKVPETAAALGNGQPSLNAAGLQPVSHPTAEAQPPRYGYRKEPRYPALAVRRGYEGTTLLRVRILPDGRVAEVEVKESSGHRILDKAARNAVDTWRFTPALFKGNPVASWVLVPISFKLE